MRSKYGGVSPLYVAAPFLLALAAVAAGQSIQPGDAAAGKLLVASRDLRDPNFAGTVVLLVHHSEDAVVGLIVNRRTKVAIERVFDELKGAKGRSDPVYAGGPVGRTGVLALMRSTTAPEGAEHLFGDVYLVSSRKLLESTLAAGIDASRFHIYLGYAGWTAQQLDGEVDQGAWYIFPGSADMVFDPKPEALWPRLIGKTENLIAGALPRP